MKNAMIAMLFVGFAVLVPGLAAVAANNRDDSQDIEATGGREEASAVGRERVWGPYYNAHTKSYFELREIRYAEHGYMTGSNWRSIRGVVATKFYKGVAGRLAIVKDAETHDFLLTHFRTFGPTWIGMTVKCLPKGPRAYWDDGTPVDSGGFSAWDMERWYRTDVNCMNNHIDYMPVYYQSAVKGFRWQASGPEKYFKYAFIEFPTGKP